MSSTSERQVELLRLELATVQALRDELLQALNDTARPDLKDNINQLRDMVQALKVERNAARIWAKAWKRAAKKERLWRMMESRAVRATQQSLVTEYERMTNIATQRDAALRVVEAARGYRDRNVPASEIFTALREWEAAQAKELQ